MDLKVSIRKSWIFGRIQLTLVFFSSAIVLVCLHAAQHHHLQSVREQCQAHLL